MAEWVITATTIYCDAVDDEVTLIVYRDGTSRCTGSKKYGKPGREKGLGNKQECAEPACSRLIQYREKSLAE